MFDNKDMLQKYKSQIRNNENGIKNLKKVIAVTDSGTASHAKILNAKNLSFIMSWRMLKMIF